MRNEYINLVKKTITIIKESEEAWNRYTHLTDYLKKEGFKYEEGNENDDISTQMHGEWSKEISEVPYSKTVSVTINDDNVIEIYVYSSQSGRSSTESDSFTDENRAIEYIKKAIK